MSDDGRVATAFAAPCARCGESLHAHYAANYSDGHLVAGTVLVCPTAIYQPRAEPAQGVSHADLHGRGSGPAVP